MITKKSRLSTFLVSFLIALVATTGFGYYRYSQPIAEPTILETLRVEQNETLPDISWPAAAASIGTVSDGVLISKPNQTPLPTASTAKLITALTVLNKYPITPGEQGPVLTMDEGDVARYREHSAIGGSTVAIRAGEQLSLYQLLQGVLIRSGNNLADSVAVWAFGSLGEYQKAAQQLVDELDMTNTSIGPDASGLSMLTTSTAEDLTKLGIAAMKNSVVKDIVRQTSSNFPNDGTKPNTNWMLGQNGVVGIKTGSLPQIGGVFVIASEFTPENEDPITIVGAVQGAPTTYDAILQANQLAEQLKPLFVRRTIIEKGTPVATLSTPWGKTSTFVAASDMTIVGWQFASIGTPTISLDYQLPLQQGQVVGSATIAGQTIDVVALDALHHPSWQWKLKTNR